MSKPFHSSVGITYRMCHEVQMWKSGSKVGPVNIGLSSTLWKEKSMASWTKYIHSVISWQIRKADRKNRLSLAKDSWTPSKGSRSIFFVHCMHPSVGDNVAAVKKSKKQGSLAKDKVLHPFHS